MKRIGVFHTTSMIIPALKDALASFEHDYRFYHMLDEGLLRLMMEEDAEDRVLSILQGHADAAQREGMDMLLLTCSSLSAMLDRIHAPGDMVLKKIDTAMYEYGVNTFRSIGLVVTNPTSMVPSEHLFRQTCQGLSKFPVLEKRILSDAFVRLQTGDVETHDRLVLDSVGELSRSVEMIILAQISIDRVKKKLPQHLQSRVFSSLDFLSATLR